MRLHSHMLEKRRDYLRGIASLGLTGVASLTGCLQGITGGSSTVTFGAVLPISMDGVLGRIGKHHAAAVRQAAADVNRAGGIHGRDVDVEVRDSQAAVEPATEAYRSLVDAGVVGLVGGVLSQVSIALAETVADDAIMQVSPASTSPKLADMGRAGDLKFFGRTVPNDSLQSFVMAKILNNDQYVGADTAAILYIDNAFGAGLAEQIRSAFAGDVVATAGFDPAADDHRAVIEDVVEADPDGVALVSQPGSAQSLLEQRLEIDAGGEWVLSAGLVPEDPPAAFDGVYSGSLASSQATGAAKLNQKLGDYDSLAPFTLNAYDALFVQALALERADDVSAEGASSNLRSVTTGTGHTVTVGEFERARRLLSAGRNINYMGASGALELVEALEPLSPYLVQHVSDGAVTNVEILKTSFFREVLEG